jgi:hypothetical protein
MLRDAKFCHKCGAPAAGQPAAIGLNWTLLLSAVVAGVLSFGGIFLAYRFLKPEEQALKPLPQFNATPSSRQSAPAVDLSTMTPRQAADRLFNRVIAAEERGDSKEVTQFAPMAMDAYRMVKQRDADLHYHMGLISLAVGDIDEARKQLKETKGYSAEHLLGLALELRLAEHGAVESSPSDVLKRFAAAYDAEIKSGKPEYEAHRNVIDGLHKRVGDKK